MSFISWMLALKILFAQAPMNGSNAIDGEFSQKGQLVSIRLVPGKPVRLFVVGKEEARMDLSTLKVTVWRISKDRKDFVPVKQEDGYFTFQPSVTSAGPMELEVNAKPKAGLKDETFRFKVDPKLLQK